MNLLVKPFHLTPFEKNINQKANINWDDIIAYVNDLAKGGVAIADSSDGWVDFPIIPTYVSSTSMKFAGVDYTGIIQKGDKLYIDQSGNKYFYITAVTFSTDTTVTVTGGSDYTVANATIVNPQFSKQATPQGFPLQHNWTPGFTGFSVNPTVTAAKFSISGGMANVSYIQNASGTSNATGFTITGLPISAGVSDESSANRLWIGRDNGVGGLIVYCYVSGTTLTVEKTWATVASWTASGSKGLYQFTISYPI
ncbi:MAG TPA: hypothetical protein PLN86_16930 [Candidatus Hydrogenedentes bacterium]|mgnify:CR=1 FL=1|nr:hypothetical protein [Candidatus Hydrogenedentota bacterium]